MYSELDALGKTLDTALTRISEEDPDSPVIPNSYRSDIDSGVDTFSLGASFRKAAIYEEAVLFVRTVIAHLRLMTVDEISDDTEEALRHLYRFVNGVLREVRHKLDPETTESPSLQTVKNLQAEWKYLDDEFVFDSGEARNRP